MTRKEIIKVHNGLCADHWRCREDGLLGA
jgi:hypothetical protein